jgi:hypothetical protein
MHASQAAAKYTAAVRALPESQPESAWCYSQPAESQRLGGPSALPPLPDWALCVLFRGAAAARCAAAHAPTSARAPACRTTWARARQRCGGVAADAVRLFRFFRVPLLPSPPTQRCVDDTRHGSAARAV